MRHDSLTKYSFHFLHGGLPMKGKNESEQLLNRKEAARYLNVSPGTLAVWDCTKRYNLKPLKVGRSVRYRKSHLDKFLEGQLTT
ncbi:helix-turn-helix domain-containing protein [Chryseolinea sp. H1M3-3]|uniref:helix-turn-helix domain-containing protein n=1 Tax=Chryseolinea sp. H1M3-3 TaxID=3034144 RepID=UPI0023EC5C03|nr:helix-turn-helix domain-containing protein [Chryseolinea sp. H1M3-3]